MKYSHLHLESFETGSERVEHVVKTLAELEEDRLNAFEKGYAAGWEDSTTTREAEEGKIRSAIGQSLQELSFTYHEARHHMLETLRPLVTVIVEKVLPSAASASLPQIVAEQIRNAAQSMTDVPVVVFVNPASIPAVHELVSERSGFPVTFNADPTLTIGQAYIKFPDAETRIDLDEVIIRISSIFDTYFSASPQENYNG